MQSGAVTGRWSGQPADSGPPPHSYHTASALHRQILYYLRPWESRAPPLEMPPKKMSGPQPAEGKNMRWQRPWELGDPEWETTLTSKPAYEPWSVGFSLSRLEITLDSLRQSQLWLSSSLRLLAESVNTDQGERDLLVYELKEKVQSMDWRLSALEDKVSHQAARRNNASARDARQPNHRST